MTDNRDSDTPTALTVEQPAGETPAEDVACADCGSYRDLFGPLNFAGEVVAHGDFVCRPCGNRRGAEIGPDEINH